MTRVCNIPDKCLFYVEGSACTVLLLYSEPRGKLFYFIFFFSYFIA